MTPKMLVFADLLKRARPNIAMSEMALRGNSWCYFMVLCDMLLGRHVSRVIGCGWVW